MYVIQQVRILYFLTIRDEDKTDHIFGYKIHDIRLPKIVTEAASLSFSQIALVTPRYIHVLCTVVFVLQKSTEKQYSIQLHSVASMNSILRRTVPTATFAVAAAAADWSQSPFTSESEATSTVPSSTESETSFVSKTRITATSSAASQPRIANSHGGSKLLFLGSGSSTGCPKPLCSLLFPEQNVGAVTTTTTNSGSATTGATENPSQHCRDQSAHATACRTSRLATRGDPRHNKDYRNNPSLLIQFVEPPVHNDVMVSSSSQQQGVDGRGGVGDSKETLNTPKIVRNVVIDVGKTFRETAIRWMPSRGIHSLDAVILTHHHMDAVAGLDDLRGFQMARRHASSPPIRVPMPIYASRDCWDQVARQFPWLVPNYDSSKAGIINNNNNKHDDKSKSKKNNDTDGVVPVHRDVATLQVNLIHEFEPFDVFGLRVTPLPVWHGDDLICLGYAFSLLPSSISEDNDDDKKDGSTATAATTSINVVYLSDISRMKEDTLDYIQTQLPPTDVLVVDALLMDHTIHPVHFNLPQAIALAKQLGAKKTLLVGMNCDAFLPHDEMNAYLRDTYKGMDVSLAYDGLLLEF